MSLPPPGTPVPDIDGPARKELRHALLEAFPQPSDLAMLVEDILNERFVNISLANDMPTRTFDLIGWAKARGRLGELVLGASSERPTGPQGARLRTFVERLSFPTAPAAAGEETIQQADVPFENPTEWIARFTRGRAAVARIEPQPLSQSNVGFGTGFLVGPDLLLTNFHIIDSGVFKPESVVVRFDCEFGPDNKETAGRTCKLADVWNVASSARVANGGLDFALVRLADKAADDTTPTGKRGWLKLHAQEFVANRPVCILQHPAARPMKLAWGVVKAVAPSPVQVGYDANTEGGSSGSPCFSAALDVVALHHMGGPKDNCGVTATALLQNPALQNLPAPPAA